MLNHAEIGGEVRPAGGSDEAACPECAETIKARARVCRFCGYDLIAKRHRRLGSASPPRARPALVRLEKSPGIAALLSAVYPGIGQMYAGAVGKGIWIVIGPPVAFIVYWLFAMSGWTSDGTAQAAVAWGFWLLLLVYLGFYVWQILDAARCAEQANAGRRRTTRRPVRARPRRRKARRRF